MNPDELQSKVGGGGLAQASAMKMLCWGPIERLDDSLTLNSTHHSDASNEKSTKIKKIIETFH